MGCGTENIEDKEFQDLSGWNGGLFCNGITLETLRSKLFKGESSKEVRVYTVKTTRLDKNLKVVRHLGSGPNLEGGLATLCTCKHSMRQNHTCEDWKDRWILGLTSRAQNNGFNGEHYLFYMMKVEKAFESHNELYEYLGKKNSDALQIKNAVKNPLGDIFQPTDNCTVPLDPKMYKTPHRKHSHGYDGDTQWHDDIVYDSKPAPLLLGNCDNTFVWPQPMIRFKQNRGVGNKKLTLEELFREGDSSYLEACK